MKINRIIPRENPNSKNRMTMPFDHRSVHVESTHVSKIKYLRRQKKLLIPLTLYKQGHLAKENSWKIWVMERLPSIQYYIRIIYKMRKGKRRARWYSYTTRQWVRYCWRCHQFRQVCTQNARNKIQREMQANVDLDPSGESGVVRKKKSRKLVFMPQSVI